MMQEHYPLILDSLIVILLAATIVYAAVLNRRLSKLRDNRAELEKAVRSFGEAAGRADAGIKGLRQAAGDTGAALLKDIERAQALKDELSFLVDTAEAVAARMEGAASGAGKSAQARQPAKPGGEPLLRAVQGESSTARRAGRPQPDSDLLKAIENMR
ncbi:DUF6468 domain-containing protein [Inquilinus sp. CAU 1745]|uniref:DUF6468 domain-containing protein n=1 Tax=Inquilinus sp. CAU 1745 TaxID=3140369 RepID=UPI00325B5264